LIDEVPLKNVEYFNYLGSVITNSRGLSLQSSIQQDEYSFHHQIRLKFNKETREVLHWIVALYGDETWTLRRVDRKYLERFEMWCWRRLEKISWTDHV